MDGRARGKQITLFFSKIRIEPLQSKKEKEGKEQNGEILLFSGYHVPGAHTKNLVQTLGVRRRRGLKPRTVTSLKTGDIFKRSPGMGNGGDW